MINPPHLSNEAERLKALSEYRILGTKPEQTYDDITGIAARVCEAPIALISLVDSERQWFKSKVGTDVEETPRDWSFCAHAIEDSEPLVVEDALADRRFADNPLVCGEPGIRLYAGFPLSTDDSLRIGTLCVIDTVPRTLSENQLFIMKALARQVVAFLELRKRSVKLIENFCNHKGTGEMITTCAYCRKAKDSDGKWEHLDQYLGRHSTLNFSHGICEQCMQVHFPEVLNAWSAKK